MSLAAKNRTESGDYRLPGATSRRARNGLIGVLRHVPYFVRKWYVDRHNHYQAASSGGELGQGDPAKKYAAMRLPPEMTGFSVLDIGCAEGYFPRECARRGANRVVGIDANLGSVLCAAFLAKEERVSVDFKIGLFPDYGLTESFDLVFCLSVLHHMVSTKDIWLVLSDSDFQNDLGQLRLLLKYLYERTRSGGRCIVEIPYEPATEQSLRSVNFDQFTKELLRAGFSVANRLGSWDFDDACAGKKERQIYDARR